GNILWEYAFNWPFIIPAPLLDDDYIYITADEAEKNTFPIYTALLTQAKDSSANYRVEWKASGAGIVEPAYEVSDNAVFQTFLKLPTTAGETVYVTANHNSSGGAEIKSAEYFIEPGEPAAIEVTQSGKTVIGGLGGIDLNITVKDKFGNRVSNGTPVDINAPGLRVKGGRTTVNGNLNVKLIGYETAGEQKVIIKSGEVETNTSVNIHDIELAIDVESKITVGKTVPVTVNVNSEYGDLSGLKIRLASVRGNLANNNLVIKENVGKTKVFVGNYRGNGHVYAVLGKRIIKKKFEVIEPKGIPYILDNLLVTDKQGPGSFMAEGHKVEYTNRTHVVVPGKAGEDIELSLLDYLKPPLVPTLNLPMRSKPAAGNIYDVSRGHQGSVFNVDYTTEYNNKFKSAYVFSGKSLIKFTDTSGLYSSGNVGFVTDIKPKNLSGVIIDYAAAGLTLKIKEQKLLLEYKTKDNLYQLVSDELSENQWYAVAAHVIEDKLVLQVNEEIRTSSIDANSEIKRASYALKVGSRYSGLISGVSLYNWNEPKTISFADENDRFSTKVGNDGYAKIPIKINNTPFVSAAFEKNSRLRNTLPGSFLINSAFADEVDNDACRNYVPNDVDIFSLGGAYLKFIAECDIQNRISEAKIAIKTATSKTDRIVAMMSYALYQKTYYQLYASGVMVENGPECFEGAFIGNVDSVAAGVCDFATSLLLIGDIRDFLKHSYYLFSDDEDFDKPTYVFASLGILTTLAEVTGVGVAVDAAVAGGKISSKILKNSAVIRHLTDYIDDKILSLPMDELSKGLKKILPMLQVVSVVSFYGGDIKKLLVDAIESPEDFIAWVDYLVIYFERWDGVEDAFSVSSRDILDWFIASANASTPDKLIEKLMSKGVKKFVKLLENVSSEQHALHISFVKNPSTGNVGQEFTDAISALNRLPDTPSAKEVRAIMHEEPVVYGIMLIDYIGGKKAVEALRRYPLGQKSSPFRDKSFKAFFEDISYISVLAEQNKISKKALKKLKKEFHDLGRVIQSAKNGNQNQINVHMAKGVAGVITAIRRIADRGKVIADLEVEEVFIDGVGKTSGRRMDVKTADGELIEVKGWCFFNMAL
ncbi:hypothetical protein, partial [Zooshikella harenae]